jgi:hypothetical protein
MGAALVLPGFLVVTILLVGAAMSPALGWRAMGLVLPFAAVGGTWLAIGPLRVRGVRVILHQRGLIVSTRRTRDVILFSTVRDVWWDGLSTFAYGARIAGLRLVDDRSRPHIVPVGLDRGDEVIRWVERHCTEPLTAEARAALQGGETLTFGAVSFDREHLCFRKVRVPWGRIRLVRLLPGRVAFFRSLPVFPWRSVRLDRVPHPSLFVRLLRDVARNVEIYPPSSRSRVDR